MRNGLVAIFGGCAVRLTLVVKYSGGPPNLSQLFVVSLGAVWLSWSAEGLRWEAQSSRRGRGVTLGLCYDPTYSSVVFLEATYVVHGGAGVVVWFGPSPCLVGRALAGGWGGCGSFQIRWLKRRCLRTSLTLCLVVARSIVGVVVVLYSSIERILILHCNLLFHIIL